MNRGIAILNLLRDRFYSMSRKIGVDRAVLLGILTRLWNIVAVPVTLLLIAYKFSPQLQGYYYTFLSIIGFQFLMELGLSGIIIQFASHEWSRLSLDNTGRIVGERDALSRLQSLAQISFRWYFIAGIILTVGLGIGGYLFFSTSQKADINWMLPWYSLCVCNGAIFCLVPVWSLLEGCNQVSKLYAYKLVQSMFLNLSLWVAILSGAQLWAMAISNMAILICAGLFLKYKCREFIKSLFFSISAGSHIIWRKEMLSLQWRVALTWLIGSFAFTLFVPVLFRYYGPVVAGQMGMTWSLVSVVLSIASAWLSPKIPQFGMLIAKKKYRELDSFFWRTTKIAIVAAIIAAVIAWLAVYTLYMFKLPVAARFLPPLTTGLFLLSQVIIVTSWPFATYLRVHKKEPLLFAAIGSGIFIGLSTLILGKYYSAIGMAVGYLSINLILTPIVLIIWRRCRVEWHNDEFECDMVLESGVMANRAG